jgi:hypothetical protein
MKALIGSNHLVKVERMNGKMTTCQFQVRELSHHPDAKVKAMCLFCRKTWETAEQLVNAHEDSNALAAKNEPHVFALWSDDPIDLEEATAPTKDGKTPKRDGARVLGLLSDEWPSV